MSLKLKYDDHDIEITFNYGSIDSSRFGMDELTRRVSKAYLYMDSQLINNGQAICHPDDRFSKKFGRKLALTKAIRDLDKSTRSAIWKKYKESMKV